MRTRCFRRAFLFLVLLWPGLPAVAQKLNFPKNATGPDACLGRDIKALAGALAGRYQSPDRQTFLDNRFRIQLVAHDYTGALLSLDSLVAGRGSSSWDGMPAMGIQFRAFAMVKRAGVPDGGFDEAYTDTLAHLFARLPEASRPYVRSFFDADVPSLEVDLNARLGRLQKQTTLRLAEAVALIRDYNAWNVYRQVMGPGQAFLAAEERRQFITQDSLLIPGDGGAQLSAVVVRRRDATGPQPVVLMYSIYAGPDDLGRAQRAAYRGYTGVVVNTRGKRFSPQAAEPFEHDAADAYAVLDWIANQPWCNGKIGMYGGSYLGFAQWSTLKKPHPALKTVVPQVAVGIGIDYPAHYGVFMTYALQWIHFVTNNKTTDDGEFGDYAKWSRLDREWYRSGRPFRTLDSLEGRPNVLFQRWLMHPTHDSFWQAMVPSGPEFAGIHIPILTTTGYFDADQRGALYYYTEHLKHRPDAEHYLLIGPYDHSGAQSAAARVVQGYTIDSVARINLDAIVFQWFDYILKGAAKPAILRDKVNYQVLGTNTWESKPGLGAVGTDSLVLYLAGDGKHGRLSRNRDADQRPIRQRVRYDRRADVDDDQIIVRKLHVRDQLVFSSEPLAGDLFLTGSFGGRLRLTINRQDVDLKAVLYELRKDCTYFRLSDCLWRASLAKDRSRRQLLRPGVEEDIPIPGSFFMAKKLEQGSRIVLVLGMNKSASWQVNYGSGKDVSDESRAADGQEPLDMAWSGESVVILPVERR